MVENISKVSVPTQQNGPSCLTRIASNLANKLHISYNYLSAPIQNSRLSYNIQNLGASDCFCSLRSWG